MSIGRKFCLVFSLFVLGLGITLSVLSQEIPVTDEVTEALNLDEDIQPEDLEIKEPKLLPDSPFYFLKNWGRGIQSFFTFNSVRKAELKLNFANEKLIEVKKLIEKKKDPEVIKKGLENYQEEIEKIKSASDKIKEKAAENPEVSKFLDKFTKHQILHQKLLSKLETQVPSQAFEKIKEARERHLERFKDVMLKLEDIAGLPERLEKNMTELEGSKYKNFKNLEILIELEEKVPEEAKEAIQKAQENALKRLQGDLEKMSPEDQERFKEYLEKISGDKEKQLEILENLKSEKRDLPAFQEKLEEWREKIIEKISEKAEEKNCPQWTPPAPDFCKEGRIIIKRSADGCPLEPECIIPGELEIPKPEPTPITEKPTPITEVCITLWNPVCGKDGKTYSNACFARLAGIEVAYKGKCGEKQCSVDTDCPQPKCGVDVKCIGVRAKCVEGQCEIVPTR